MHCDKWGVSMGIDDLKAKAMERAMQFMQSDKGQEVMSDPRVQKAISQVFQTSMAMRAQVDGLKKTVADQLNLVAKDDLREMKRELDRMKRKITRMEAEAQGAEEALPEPPKRAPRRRKDSGADE